MLHCGAFHRRLREVSVGDNRPHRWREPACAPDCNAAAAFELGSQSRSWLRHHLAGWTRTSAFLFRPRAAPLQQDLLHKRRTDLSTPAVWRSWIAAAFFDLRVNLLLLDASRTQPLKIGLFHISVRQLKRGSASSSAAPNAAATQSCCCTLISSVSSCVRLIYRLVVILGRLKKFSLIGGRSRCRRSESGSGVEMSASCFSEIGAGPQRRTGKHILDSQRWLRVAYFA